MKKILLLILAFSVTAVSQYTTFRIHPSDTNQIEPSISRHPLNHNIMFSSAYTAKSSFRSEGVYVTTNGGASWYGIDKCTGGSANQHGGDPGPIIDKDGRFILTHVGGINTGMYANWSSDNGITWSAATLIASGDQDKGSPATDDAGLSPYYGRSYLVWTKFTSPFPINLSLTTNGGLNWSAAITVNNSFSGHASYGPTAAVNANGVVFVSWAAVILQSPLNEDYIGVARSSNGGINWIVNEQAFDVNGIKVGQLAPWNIRVNSYPIMDIDRSGGSRHGWIYIITNEKNLAPADAIGDVILHRSTDGGNTWSQAIRVNQDPVSNGKIQFFPFIKVDDNGGLNVVYYDNRDAPSDSVGVYLSRSVDGGDTWMDIKINDHWFRPQTATGFSGIMGDNIGMTVANGKLWPVWMSNKTGVYQVWTTSIDINTIGVNKTGNEIPKIYSLHQNYPNPFNPETTIKFEVPKNSHVKIFIYDVNGRMVETIVNNDLDAGSYETKWNAAKYSSGLYFYRIETNNYSETKKMIYIK